MRLDRLIFAFLFTMLLLVGPVLPQTVNEVASPAIAAVNRERGLSMLDDIKDIMKERYYDKTFHGIDLDARFKTAKERVKKMDFNWQIFRVIAQVVLDFDDSHTTFLPPNRANSVEYGFSMQMIGANCYVIDVKKGSDAEAKGVKPGDAVIAVGQYGPTRQNLWRLNYLLYALDPQQSIKLILAAPNGPEREIEVKATFKSIEDRKKEAEKHRKDKREDPYRCQKVNSESIACKLKTFSVEKKFIDRMMTEASAYKKLILDLRGNRGGLVSIEEYLTGFFFDHDVKIATFIRREKPKDAIGKSRGDRIFKGDLVVLIDSNSASASEVFARVMQIEKRAKIIGDTSAGAVMTSNFFTLANVRGVSSMATVSFFGLNLTVADLIMSDGNRLEKVGVIPDQPARPTGFALQNKMDPVLAYAASLLGAKLSAEETGDFHFITKKEEVDDDDEADDGDG